MQPTSLVTGATGFLASHVVDQLLKAGHRVIGTVRSPTKAARLAEAFNTQIASGQLELETLSDVRNAGEFQVIFEKHPEIKYILHTASPFNYNTTDPEKEMLQPAVEGTTTVLKAAKAYAHNVEKVVITSSLAAILNIATFNDPSTTLTEKDWNPITSEQAAEKGNPFANYIGSKAMAEKASVEFEKTEKPKFKLTWVNPVLILGPGIILDPQAINTSNEAIVNALATKPGQKAPVKAGYFVDVRDCAKAHVSALQPELDGRRLFLSTSKYCTQDFLKIAGEMPEFKGKIAEFDPAEREKELHPLAQIDNSVTLKLLNYDLISLDQSVTDFAKEWLSYQKE
ncbi:putative NADPH-dependent methylglyoxal reductase GRP2 [Yarrowia sp. C11]|nr:putative NADPH-dependent methylglyoxal reductase GRP2 [Yarrowia sp. C11]